MCRAAFQLHPPPTAAPMDSPEQPPTSSAPPAPTPNTKGTHQGRRLGLWRPCQIEEQPPHVQQGAPEGQSRTEKEPSSGAREFHAQGARLRGHEAQVHGATKTVKVLPGHAERVHRATKIAKVLPGCPHIGVPFPAPPHHMPKVAMVPEATSTAPLYCCHRLPILRLSDAGSLAPSLGLPPLLGAATWGKEHGVRGGQHGGVAAWGGVQHGVNMEGSRDRWSGA